MTHQRSRISYKKGLVLVNVIVFATIAVVITTALTQWAGTVFKSSRTLNSKEQAFQIAEAGIEYYRWHLAHAPTDYRDGTATTGPYIHPYHDKDGNYIGQFKLTITPPITGSTIVRILSEGTVTTTGAVTRKIQATLAIPSFAKYAVVANDVMRFGAGTEVFGPIHSNNGINFSGVAHNIISSARDQYIDPDYPGVQRFGVYTQVSPVDPSPPAAVPSRPDVFMAGRQFPVPAVDFAGITTDLSQMKSDAISNGRYIAASGAQGYRLVLRTNDSVDVYRINSLLAPPNSTCSGNSTAQGQARWGTWSIGTGGGAQTFVANYPFPSNGIIFVEDNTWVEGQINGARISIAAGRFPDNAATRPHITINNNLTYTNYDGTDVLGLIAQGNINVGLRSLDTQRIDAALMAQNGRVGRYYYSSQCGTGYERDTLTLYGMIGSNLRYGFAYTDGTGYANRNIIYDNSLLYGPPPSFPLTSDQYITLSWSEVN